MKLNKSVVGKAVISIVLVTSIVVIWNIFQEPLSDPNQGLYNGSGAKDAYLPEGRVYYLSGAVNITQDQSHHVYLWYNQSALGDLRWAYIVYYNGTHNPNYDGNLTTPWGSPNLDWWTEKSYLFADVFNSSEFYPQQYNIPAQEPGTTVTYQLRFHIWSEGQMIYRTVNQTYTVIYSDLYIEAQELLHSIVEFYFVTFPIIILSVMALFEISSRIDTSPSLPIIDIRDAPLAKLEKPILVARCDKMEDIKNNLLIQSAALVGLGSFWSLVGFDIINGMFTSFGSIILVILSFLSVMASIPEINATAYDTELSMSLLPRGQNEQQYEKQLEYLIERKEKVNKNMKSLMHLGVGVFVASIIADIISPIFPYHDNLAGIFWWPYFFICVIYAMLWLMIMILDIIFSLLRK
ncbi:MAG: hypothetical protein JW779_05605 [Candidatus Thorarchaeota archaeon]|nr:hypothetical protein [Candidatus Thorarchaeota archaeon]